MTNIFVQIIALCESIEQEGLSDFVKNAVELRHTIQDVINKKRCSHCGNFLNMVAVPRDNKVYADYVGVCAVCGKSPSNFAELSISVGEYVHDGSNPVVNTMSPRI